jgi:HlyD family secretion protein
MEAEAKSTPAWRLLRHHLVLPIIGLALILVLAYALSGVVLGPRVPAQLVMRQDVLQTVVASGRVETPLRVDIGTQVTGTVAAIPVAEGQTIRAGQLLIALEDHEARAAVAAAQAGAVQAQARLNQIHELTLPAAEEALHRAKVSRDNALRDYKRSVDLLAQGFIGQSQLDALKTSLDVAESQVRSAQLDVDSNRSHGSAAALAETDLAQARATLATAQARLDYTTIEAPVAGTLIARDVERGDVVQPGKALMVLSPAGSAQLVVQIDEKNLASLRLGQPALASADAYPADRFAAQVVYINPSVDPQRGSIEVKLSVDKPPDYLRQDMTVSVDIEVARRQHALVVPGSAVHDSSGATPWVLKLAGHHALRQPVKLGASGIDKVEVLAGLAEGDAVLIPAAPLKANQRVRAVLSDAKAGS